MVTHNVLGIGEGAALEFRQLKISTNVDRSTNVQLLPSVVLLPILVIGCVYLFVFLRYF
jgi:hypothetical protein